MNSNAGKPPFAAFRALMLGSVPAALLSAAVMLMPDAADATIISLDDPSFENFVVPPPGYAYADKYRPTSAWVDDLDSPVGYTQDDQHSNWLYTANYANSGLILRASPLTGNQAMHGSGNYNAQETGAVFEALTTYTFSIWAQGDEDATASSSRLFLYLFDAALPFSDANSLASLRYAPDTGDFVNRPPGSTGAESQALWTEISLSYTVLSGAPEIGHPIGVGFWLALDAAVDDASLIFTSQSPPNSVPEPSTAALLGTGMAGLVLLRHRRRKTRGP